MNVLKPFVDASCTSIVCGQNEYCKSENGVPKCVKKSTGSGKFLKSFIFLAYNTWYTTLQACKSSQCMECKTKRSSKVN